jgi:hypothetical protein
MIQSNNIFVNGRKKKVKPSGLSFFLCLFARIPKELGKVNINGSDESL